MIFSVLCGVYYVEGNTSHITELKVAHLLKTYIPSSKLNRSCWLLLLAVASTLGNIKTLFNMQANYQNLQLVIWDVLPLCTKLIMEMK